MLLNHQISHSEKLKSILERKAIAIDGSGTGEGKTYVACHLAKTLDMNLFVVTTISAISHWVNVAKTIGVREKLIGITNYESFRNAKYYPDGETDDRRDCPFMEFRFTGDFMDIHWSFPKNTLIVLDEMHKAKNGLASGHQSQISRIIVSLKSFISLTDRRYLLLLSATITDKLASSDVLLHLLGLYGPYNKKSYDYFLTKLDPNKDENVLMQKINKLLYPSHGSSMVNEDERDITAVAYKVEEEVARQIDDLHREIEHNKTLEYEYRMKIELLKVNTVVMEVKRCISESKSAIVFVNFIKTREAVIERLNEIGIKAATIYGGQKQSERDDYVDQFQKNILHVMVSQIQAGGQSISLHDLEGRQRETFIFPPYGGITLEQAFGRADRKNSRTKPIQRIVYCVSNDKKYNIEQKMLDLCNESIRKIRVLHLIAP